MDNKNVEKSKNILDVVIIGAGPAGMTAAIYASRANLDVLMIEKDFYGGQMQSTGEIENYTGYDFISGAELSEKMFSHTQKFGAKFTFGEIQNIKLSKDFKTVETTKEKFNAKTVIISTGTTPRKLNIPGEEEFLSKGVSYCATCDGAFFKGKNVVVVGGGDSAVEEALYLSNIAKKVTVVHRRDKLRAQKILQDRAFAKNNVEFLWNSTITAINGEHSVNSVTINNLHTNEEYNLSVDGVFVYVGMIPQTNVFANLGILDENGYVVASEDLSTKIPGVFVAGDVRQKETRQIVTATSDGAIAAQSAFKFIEVGSVSN